MRRPPSGEWLVLCRDWRNSSRQRTLRGSFQVVRTTTLVASKPRLARMAILYTMMLGFAAESVTWRVDPRSSYTTGQFLTTRATKSEPQWAFNSGGCACATPIIDLAEAGIARAPQCGRRGSHSASDRADTCCIRNTRRGDR